jgi:penicillin amidase
VEYELTGLTPEPWEPWHSVAAYKIRHVLMGPWQTKLAQAELLIRIGPDAYLQLDGRAPVGSPVILPPGGRYERLVAEAVDVVHRAAEQLGFLAEAEAGSNSWVVHGSRTTTGAPVLCNDSHRALDVPNVYWQVHVACPAFDVIGATFPGLPGFPHFGHNGHVGWNITHTCGDYQDLYVEQFEPLDGSGGAGTGTRGAPPPDRVRIEPDALGPTPGAASGIGLRYRTPDGWATAALQTEQIQVAGGEPVQIEVWRTRHGPVVHGDPRRGWALALRYTATDGPCLTFEVLRPMLLARTVAELHQSQRQWVDPVNNLVSADTAGTIGYLTRGYLPIRSSPGRPAGGGHPGWSAQFPAPGWTGEHEWVGRVPFGQLPQAVNPPEGFIATANQAVISGDEPYIAHDFSSPARAERIVELLTARERMTPGEIIAMQGDTTSRPARAWVRLLRRLGPLDGDAERARALLANWDGNLLPDSAPAFLYGYFRRAAARAVFEPVVGAEVWTWLTTQVSTTTHAMITRWMANVIASLDSFDPLDGAPEASTTPGTAATPATAAAAWEGRLPAALASAWRAATAHGGPDPAAWRWDSRHYTNAQHPLVARFPERATQLNPPRVRIGGDGETIQAASYYWGDRADFAIVGLSVYRQAIDLRDIADATFVVPGGASGSPASPHAADQLEPWRTHRRIPMLHAPAAVQAAAVETLVLTPA